jgi:hypothetical protein
MPRSISSDPKFLLESTTGINVSLKLAWIFEINKQSEQMGISRSEWFKRVLKEAQPDKFQD